MHRYLGTGEDTLSEVKQLAEIKKIAVIIRSNLVNVVSLMSAAQEPRETCRSYLTRIQGLVNVCKLSVVYTAAACDEQVSYQPSGEGGTRSPPATPHRLHNPRWPPGGPKRPTGSGKVSTPRFLGILSNFR